MSVGMRFAVLGPLRAWRHGTELDIGQPQQRALLAALILREGAQATVDGLVDDVWGDGPPDSAVGIVRNYIHRLRRLLGPDGATLIRSVGGGYALGGVAAEDVDLALFKRFVGEARAEHGAGNAAAAAERFAAGLALWTGPALAGVPGPCADIQRTRLTELRLVVLEEWLACVIELGRPAEAVSELAPLVAEHPLRERFRVLQMTALYGAGRQAEALGVFRDVALLLREELGVDPCPELREVHQRVLANDLPQARPTAAGARPEAAPVSGREAERRITPAQLPADLPDFIGREHELEEITGPVLDGARGAAQNTASQTSGTPSDAAAVGVIHGMGGIGKTALAVRWAHRNASRFPDGQLYADLRGFDPDDGALLPGDVLEEFLVGLGVAPRDVPASLSARSALFRSLMAGRRILVLLDNARDAGQVRPLLPGASGCATLVTSRNRLSGLIATHHARALRLRVLEPGHAREFLVRSLGPGRVDAEPDPVDEVIEYCGGLPLALAVVAARAGEMPDVPLAAIAAELRAARGSLEALSVEGDPAADTRAVFSWSYRSLSGPAARLFRLLALHPGLDIPISAVAALVAAPRRRARALVDELTNMHLLTEQAPDRFTRHDLLSAYASELVHLEDSQRERDHAVERLLFHYTSSAAAASAIFSPVRLVQLEPVPARDRYTVAFADADESARWFAAEHPNLVRLIGWAERQGFDEHTWRLALALEHFLDRRGLWHDLIAVQRIALEAAQRIGDPVPQAFVRLALARGDVLLRRFDAAHAHLRVALRLFEAAGHAAARAETHRQISWVLEQQGLFEEALAEARRCLSLQDRTGALPQKAAALNAVGWYCALLGQYREALAHCEEALGLLRELEIPYAEADTLDSIGYAQDHLGLHAEAIASYHQALGLYREIGVQFAQADTLGRLGDACRSAGRPDAARAAWTSALEILEGLEHEQAEAVREKLRDAAASPRQLAASGTG
jgi:DNA-binding SARP family transcriptional activator